jgi:threonine aldolase
MPGAEIAAPETNMDVVTIRGPAVPAVLEAMKEQGVLAVGFGPGRIRFVTHRDVGDEDVTSAANALRRILGEKSKG